MGHLWRHGLWIEPKDGTIWRENLTWNWLDAPPSGIVTGEFTAKWTDHAAADPA